MLAKAHVAVLAYCSGCNSSVDVAGESIGVVT